jgi:hypothetical protein
MSAARKEDYEALLTVREGISARLRLEKLKEWCGKAAPKWDQGCGYSDTFSEGVRAARSQVFMLVEGVIEGGTLEVVDFNNKGDMPVDAFVAELTEKIDGDDGGES